MTIGAIITLKTRRNLWFGFVTWLLYAGSMFVSAKWGERLLPLFLFLPFVSAVVAQMFFVRCPKCKGNLGQLMAQSLAPWRMKTRLICCQFFQ